MAANTGTRLQALAAGVAASMLAACKVVVVPGQGGSVHGSDGTLCQEADLCEVLIETPDFLEEFTAVPDPGWKFLHWKERPDGFCGGSESDTCTLNTTSFAASPELMEVLVSDTRFFLEPVFEPAEPLVEEWSKVFLITNETAFCGWTGSGVPIEGRQYSSRLTKYDNGMLRMEPLDGGFLGIEDPLRVDEYFWLPTDEGEYIHRFRWEWEFEGEWRLAQGEVTWELDSDATSLTTRKFSGTLYWPDLFGIGSLPGHTCKFTTLATGTLDPESN